MIKLIKTLIVVLVVIPVILILIWGLLYSFYVNNPANKKSEDIAFQIKSGEKVKEIGKDLREKNLINSEFWFKVYVWFKDNETGFQTGKYMLNTNMSIKEITRILVTGQTLDREEEIKIIEGWNLSDIADYLDKKDVLNRDDWFNLVGKTKIDYRYEYGDKKPHDYVGQFSFLESKPDYYGLEGYLFPDTYRVYKNSTPNMIAVKMLTNFDNKLTPKMRADIKKQGKTIHEIVTMASIIQKEVQSKDDMEIVSGLFWKKIDNGKPLRSCATLAYILGKNKPQYSIEETKIDSVFNTYQNKGLPPIPICNPGIDAIKASIYPKKTDYNFFLSDPKTGKTIFSKTFEEHKVNKAKYLK